jgi:hypothetical protein
MPRQALSDSSRARRAASEAMQVCPVKDKGWLASVQTNRGVYAAPLWQAAV